ncbi:MAG: hypothetical protein ACI9HK_003586 [Pirellulaceae bacterium]|jgi:hypothetical protein
MGKIATRVNYCEHRDWRAAEDLTIMWLPGKNRSTQKISELLLDVEHLLAKGGNHYSKSVETKGGASGQREIAMSGNELFISVCSLQESNCGLLQDLGSNRIATCFPPSPERLY